VKNVALETWSGQFHVMQSEPRQFGPYAGVFHGPGSVAVSPELYLVVEPLSPHVAPAIADLLPKLGNVFEREGLSLTGALIRCIAVAHEQVRAWNLKSMPSHRAGLAIAGIALRGEQAYLAQAGPAVSYLRRGSELRRLVPPQEAATPVGLAETSQPDFNYFALRPGDTFLLAFHSIERRLEQDDVRNLLGERPDRCLNHLYEAVDGEGEFAAIVLAIEPPEGTPVDPPLPRRRTEPAARPASAPAQQRHPPRRHVVDDRQASLFGEPSAEEAQQRAADEVVASAASVEPEVPAEVSPEGVVEPAAAVEEPRHPEVPLPPVPTEQPSATVFRPPERPSILEPPLPPVPTPPPVRSEPPIEEYEPPAGDETAAGPTRDLQPGEVAERLRRVRQRPRHRAPTRPEFAEVDPSSGNPYEQVGEPPDLEPKVDLGREAAPALRRRLEVRVSRRAVILGGAALAAGGVAAAAALALPRILDDDREGRVRELVAAARARYETALAATDDAAKREGFRQAQTELEEALALIPTDAEAQQLSAEIREDLAILNREVELAEPEQLAPTTILSAPGAASQMAIAGGSVFLLDGPAQRVIYFQQTDPTAAEIVFQPGQEFEDAVTTAPVHIVHLATPRANVLLIASEDGSDYVFAPGRDPSRVRIPGRDTWGSLDGFAWTGDELFAFDLAEGDIHRYGFNGTAFSRAGQTPLGDAAPDSLVSATWSGERLYVLGGDGLVYRLGDDGLEPLELSGLDRDLRSPVGLSADTELAQVYVSDRGNNRIVALAADGKFLQQLVSPALTSLGLVHVDAPNQQIYFIAGDALYTAPLPPIRSE
jgi:hypothetical protein